VPIFHSWLAGTYYREAVIGCQGQIHDLPENKSVKIGFTLIPGTFSKNEL